MALGREWGALLLRSHSVISSCGFDKCLGFSGTLLLHWWNTRHLLPVILCYCSAHHFREVCMDSWVSFWLSSVSRLCSWPRNPYFWKSCSCDVMCCQLESNRPDSSPPIPDTKCTALSSPPSLSAIPAQWGGGWLSEPQLIPARWKHQPLRWWPCRQVLGFCKSFWYWDAVYSWMEKKAEKGRHFRGREERKEARKKRTTIWGDGK